MSRKIMSDMVEDNARKCPLPVAGKWPPYQHSKRCSCGREPERWVSEFGGWAVAVYDHGTSHDGKRLWAWEVHHDLPGWVVVRAGEAHSFEQAKLQGEAAAPIAWAIRNGCEQG